MADYQRVIEFLRDVRQGTGSAGLQTVTEEIAHMAAEYAALCVQANDRLRQCTSFLQQGLRGEAIHLAEQSPNLLDLVSQLDLPDPQAWAEFCQNNSFPVPPALQLERAAQLNEAYAQDQPLEHLLARHRLLALSRAPVRERLSSMRKIAQTDPASEHWEKDIRIFEQARLKELPSAFYNAVKNHDHHAIQGLMEELNHEQWFEPPPADLATAVADAHARVQRLAVEADLRRLVEPLREAFAARSLHECQALVQRWKNTMASGGVTSVSTELMDEIKPVVAFVGEQTKRDELLKRFHDSCKTFTKMIDADSSDSQLEAGYAKLKEFKEEIPEDLTRRYMNKRTGRRRDADRRHKLRLATIGGVFAAIIVMGLVVLFLVMRGTTADRWAKEIHNDVALHTRAGLDQAQGRVDELKKTNPGMLQEPKVAKEVNELLVQQTRYAADTQNVKASQEKLQAAGVAAAATLANSNASMDEIRASSATLDAALNQAAVLADELAWADPENQLRSAVAGAQAVRKSMQDRVLAATGAELRDIGKALDAIPANTSTPDAATEAQTQLRTLAQRVGALSNLPLLNEETKSQIGDLAGRIKTRSAGADVAGGVAEELQNVRTHAATAADLKTALDSFVARFPADPRTADFKTALQQISAADALEAWQQLLAPYQGQLAPTSLPDARKKLDAVTTFLTAHPDFPMTAQATAYGDFLHRAVDAMAGGGDKGSWQTAFADLISGPIYSELGVMEVSDGRRYYTLGDIKRVERKLMSQVSVSFQSIDLKPDADGKQDFQKRVTITIDPPLTVSAAPKPAPHAKFITDIADALKLIDDKNWDTFGIDLADRLLPNTQIDPVVKAIILQQALKAEVAVAGPNIVGDTYDRAISDLARQAPENLPWLDPSRITDGTHKALKTVMDDLQKTPAATVKARLAANNVALFKSVVLDLMSAGVLLKDDAGAWTVHSRATPLNGSIVWAITPAKTAGQPGTLTPVGTGAAGKFVLDDLALRTTPQGSIVYITRP